MLARISGIKNRDTLKRWPALIRYAETGYPPIDNNPVENCIRPIAIGKKNWMLVGSERAGKRAAAIQTLLGTAKLNDLNPSEWLKISVIVILQFSYNANSTHKCTTQ